ncbi:MAG: DUF2294 domain-containing protein [Anaerolineales bacterium]|nr:DUF2294 domain-containing protein [Anaerolineales bacterium]
MSRLSRGELEAILANALLRFEKDQLGRGPVETRAFLIENLIVIMARGVLTPEETALATVPRGPELVRQIRRELLEGSRRRLESIVQGATGCHVNSILSDIDVNTAECVFVFVLNERLDERYGWH